MRCDSGAGRRKNSLAQVTLVLRQSPTSSEICATRARVFPSVSRCCAVAVAVAVARNVVAAPLPLLLAGAKRRAGNAAGLAASRPWCSVRVRGGLRCYDSGSFSVEVRVLVCFGRSL